MEFKDVLRSIRKRRGLSQIELAEQVNLSKSIISLYESGARKPSFEALEDLADFFNVDTDYLIGREKGSMYYLQPEAAEIARALYERPELLTLFKTTMDIKSDDIKVLQDMADVLKRK